MRPTASSMFPALTSVATFSDLSNAWTATRRYPTPQTKTATPSTMVQAPIDLRRRRAPGASTDDRARPGWTPTGAGSGTAARAPSAGATIVPAAGAAVASAWATSAGSAAAAPAATVGSAGPTGPGVHCSAGASVLGSLGITCSGVTWNVLVRSPTSVAAAAPAPPTAVVVIASDDAAGAVGAGPGWASGGYHLPSLANHQPGPCDTSLICTPSLRSAGGAWSSDPVHSTSGPPWRPGLGGWRLELVELLGQLLVPGQTLVHLGQEGLDPLELGRHFLAEGRRDLETLGQDPSPGLEVLVLVPGGPEGVEPVLGREHGPDLFEVETEELLELPDPGHPGHLRHPVAARAARTVPGGDQQPDLLVVAERAFGHTRPLGHLADAQEPAFSGERAHQEPQGDTLSGVAAPLPDRRVGPASRGARRGRPAAGSLTPIGSLGSVGATSRAGS